MGEREWKPGDVATSATIGGIQMVIRDDDGDLRWVFVDGATRPLDTPTKRRPLVVIDPESSGDLERLASAWNAQTHADLGPERMSLGAYRMQAALREFADPKPPRPEEPADPKALVTDRRDNVWRLLADGEWVCTSGPDIGEYLVWSRLVERGPLEVEA